MSLVNPEDSLERQNEKLLNIAQALMKRVEQKSEHTGLAYQQFERAALLETQVRERTIELERTLDLLQESNARLETANAETEAARTNLAEAIETVNDGFALFDPDEKLVLFNSRFCRDMHDVMSNLREGLSFGDYVDMVAHSKALALPADQTRAQWSAERMALHSESHVVFNVAVRWGRWIQVSEHRTARGGTVILQTDVTEIMQNEREERNKLRDQQARTLQATLDHLDQGICIFDHTLALVGWNTNVEGLLSLPPRRAVHRLQFHELLDSFDDGVQYSDGQSADRLIKWAKQRQRRLPLKFEATRKDGRTLRVFCQEMPDRGFVISFTDVTAEVDATRAMAEINERLEQGVRDRTAELGVALAEAERANASKSRFVAAASHDLLQPLSAAKLFMSSLSDRLSDDASRGVLAKAETALFSVEKIIEALLDISRLDAGKATFKVQPVRLSAILEPLRDELTPTAAAKGLELRIVTADLTVMSDPAYLRRIVQNLMENAIKYTDQGRILVGVRRYGKSARIEVWDTGRGIAEEDQKAIFQEFERRDGPADNTGLGLGLAIVERAAAGLGHPLGIWSQPGVGSCFSLNVPLCDASKHPETPSETPRTWGKELTGQVLLLVENDIPLSAAITLMVEEHGAEVLVAHSAEEALDLLAEIELIPDGLLLDYQLGSGMSGVEFYRAFTERYGKVKAAILSANRSTELQRECREIDIPLLAKPLDKHKLFELLVYDLPARARGNEGGL